MQILKKLSKNNNEKKDLRQAAIENNSCSTCRRKGLPVCIGHAPGGGSGQEEDSFAEPEALDLAKKNPLDMLLSPKKNTSSTDKELIFNLDELLEYLLIISDPSQGKLSLYLKPGTPNQEESQSRNLIRMIRMVFNEFKKELARLGLPVNQFRCNSDPNELIISFPEPKYFDAFMQKLVNNKLLPESYLQALKLNSEKASQIKPSMTPKPRQTDDVTANQQDADSPFRPSPFRTTLELKNEPWK